VVGWRAPMPATPILRCSTWKDAALFSRVNETTRTQDTYRIAAMLKACVNIQPAVKRVDFGKQDSYRFFIPDLNLPNAAESDRASPRAAALPCHAASGRGTPASNPKVVVMTDSFSRAGQDRFSRALQDYGFVCSHASFYQRDLGSDVEVPAFRFCS
jgi:hypothetical protein